MMRSGSAPSLPAARNRGLRHVRTMRQLKLPVGQAGVRLAAAHPTSLCNRSAASQGARPATEPEESGHLGGPVARGCPATPAQQHPSVAIPPRSRGVVAAEFIPPFMDGGALPACFGTHAELPTAPCSLSHFMAGVRPGAARITASFCVFTSPFERSAGGAQIWAIGAVKMRRPPSPESPVCFGGPVGGAYVHGYGQREHERRSPPAGRADERGVLACRQLQAAVRAWANTASQRPGGITAVVLAR